MPPSGLPDAFLETTDPETALRQLVHRWARGRGPFTTAEADCALREGRRARPARSSRRKSCWCAVSCGRAAPSASGATRRCCGGCGEPRWRRCGRKWSLPSRRRSRGSSPPGTASIGARACGRRWCRCRRSRCPSRCGSRSCCPGACPITAPSSSTSCAPPARSSGSAPASTASPCTSGRTPECWEPSAARRVPKGKSTTRYAPPSSRSAEFWSDLLAATGLDAEQALPALWDLVWAGEVTNDAWQPLRAPRRYGTPKTERRPRRFARRRAMVPTATQGRWSHDGAAVRDTSGV